MIDLRRASALPEQTAALMGGRFVLHARQRVGGTWAKRTQFRRSRNAGQRVWPRRLGCAAAADARASVPQTACRVNPRPAAECEEAAARCGGVCHRAAI